MILRKVRTAAGLAKLIWIYVALGVIKHMVSLDTAARWAWSIPRRRRDVAGERRVIAQVVRLAHLLRAADSDCLHRSLLLYRELSRAGADPRLIVGFRRDDEALKGHAWVVVDGEPVAESRSAIGAFSPAVTFARHGLRSSAGALQDR